MASSNGILSNNPLEELTLGSPRLQGEGKQKRAKLKHQTFGEKEQSRE
jgi:hypothetical protein